MMNPAPWGPDLQPASGSFGGAPSGHGRGSWSSHPHGNHGPKPRHNNKRDHNAAFSKPHATVPRTPAPPPVPSFGNPLPSKPPPAADATRKPKKRKRKHNQLGLTPKTDEHESSEEEEDVDEESKLAQVSTGAAPLQFTYKGQTATLQSASDIAAWIAERRKKFPTAARVEEKKKAADEVKAARDAARREKEKAKVKESEPKVGEGFADPALDAAMKAQRKADKIRRNLDREQKRFAKAEAAAEAARLKVEALQKQAKGLDADQPQQNGVPGGDSHAASSDSVENGESASLHTTGVPSKLEILPDDTSASAAAVDATADRLNGAIDLSSDGSDSNDWTSSSGSESESDSGSEDDSAPEEVTSRRQGPERVRPPPREGKRQQLCRHFARNGQCNRGDKCKFSHEVSERGPKSKPPVEKKGRKGLLQAVSASLDGRPLPAGYTDACTTQLLDRQKEDEDRRAMEVISWLGQNGMLEPTTKSMPNIPA